MSPVRLQKIKGNSMMIKTLDSLSATDQQQKAKWSLTG